MFPHYLDHLITFVNGPSALKCESQGRSHVRVHLKLYFLLVYLSLFVLCRLLCESREGESTWVFCPFRNDWESTERKKLRNAHIHCWYLMPLPSGFPSATVVYLNKQAVCLTFLVPNKLTGGQLKMFLGISSQVSGRTLRNHLSGNWSNITTADCRQNRFLIIYCVCLWTRIKLDCCFFRQQSLF